MIAIVERNHERVIRHELDGGPVRVHRLPSAWNDGAMVLPSWTGIDGSLRADLTMVECYVNGVVRLKPDELSGSAVRVDDLGQPKN